MGLLTATGNTVLDHNSTLNTTGVMNVTGTTLVNNGSQLTAGGLLTTDGLTVDNGGNVQAAPDADTGALSLGPTTAAAMTVTGNLTTDTATLNNGSTLNVSGAMTVDGAVDVDNGAQLKADALNLAKTSSPVGLTVGNTAAASVTTHTLNVGDNSGIQRRVTIQAGSITTDILNNDSANGGILVKAAGQLNVTGALNLDGQSLINANSLQTGKIAMNGGMLNVGGGLNLTGTGPLSVDVSGSMVNAKTISAKNGATSLRLTWNGGDLTLYGDGTGFADAAQLSVGGGNLTLGGPALTVGTPPP